MIERLRYWYESDSRPAHRFRYGLLAFDIVTVVFVVASSFTRDSGGSKRSMSCSASLSWLTSPHDC